MAIERLILRKDTAANWTSANPVLAAGEPALETDTRKMKYGDGTTAWTSLAYSYSGGGGGGDVVDDTTPQLGGNLDLNSFTVGDATAADLTKLNAVTSTAAELNYTDGVTSAIQTQLDAKVASASLGASILAAVLTGLSTATNQAVAATDTVLQAFGYIQKQITDLIATVATKAKLNTSASDPTGTYSATELHANTSSGKLFWASAANTAREVFLSGLSTVGTSDIAAGAVTLAKQADMATASLVYRKTAGTGAPEINTLATLKTDLGLSGTNSGDQTATTVTNTPAGNIAATTVQAAINELDTEKQPLDADLTTIAGLTATTDSFLQSKSSAWAARTVAQVKTDLGLTGTNSGDQTTIVGITGTKAQFDTACSDGNFVYQGVTTGLPVEIGIACSDETTAITTGTNKAVFRMPYAMTVTAVRASLTTVSSSGIPTVDINDGGTTILSTKLTIDASEKTSTTAATPAVISDTALADDAEISIDVDVAGTGAAGLKVWIIGTRT